MLNFQEYFKSRSINKIKIEKIGPYSIFTVDGAAVRDMSEDGDEFDHFSTHLELPKVVPDKEIWIDEKVTKHERFFLIHSGVNEYEYKAKGKRNWYEDVLKHERQERDKVDSVKFKSKPNPEQVPESVYVKLYCDVDDQKVYLINGEKVRDLYKTDFCCGGNDQVYHKWIPRNEIWIEKDLTEKEEIPITILHEFVERTLMKYKRYSYDKAHTIATKVDFKYRRKFTKEDAENLTAKKALEMARSV